MVKKFQKAGVRAIFAGHYHRNAGGKYENMELVVTSAIGAQSPEGTNAKSGYRIVNVDEDKIYHKYVNIYSGTNSLFTISSINIFTILCSMFILRVIFN